jgi:hypothetical protein
MKQASGDDDAHEVEAGRRSMEVNWSCSIAHVHGTHIHDDHLPLSPSH